MIYYKLKITDDKVIVEDIVDDIDRYDKGYVYATKEELSKIKPELLDMSNITFDFKGL